MRARPVQRSARASNNGAVLLLAMLFLLLMGSIAATVMQTSVLEYQMSGNEQFRQQALQKARAVASAISADPTNFPLSSELGQTFCSSPDIAPNCSAGVTISLPPRLGNVPDGMLLSYQVERQGPLYLDALPARFAPQADTGQPGVNSPAYDVALFETRVIVDGRAVRQGRAEVVQGVAVLVASACEEELCVENEGEPLNVYWREPGIDEL